VCLSNALSISSSCSAFYIIHFGWLAIWSLSRSLDVVYMNKSSPIQDIPIDMFKTVPHHCLPEANYNSFKVKETRRSPVSSAHAKCNYY
jgi:hypothetical protein